MSQDPLKRRLADARKRIQKRYEDMGFIVYEIAHSPVDFKAYRIENGTVLEIRHVRAAYGRITEADEKLLKKQPRFTPLFTYEICCCDKNDITTRPV